MSFPYIAYHVADMVVHRSKRNLQMDQEHSLELSRKTEVLHLDETRRDVIPESKRGWLMRKPSKRLDLKGQSTKVVRLLLVGIMLERRLVFPLSSSRGNSRWSSLLHVFSCTTASLNYHPQVPAPGRSAESATL
jgi:hypothetical protein